MSQSPDRSERHDAHSPQRALTDPDPDAHPGATIKTRIIVCCDGTWQDGIINEQPWKYTNVLKLARTINHQDERLHPAIPQIVFYQSGIGSAKNFYAEFIEGPLGSSLGDKVEEAYAFIAHNYQPGDEIFLFGFSRGAYTARMVAAMIGEIGVLDRTDMDNFETIFVNYQKRGKAKDQIEIDALDKKLAPWTHSDSPGKKRANSDAHSFSVKCVGVFDTVGSVGLPEELTLHSEQMKKIYGFPDRKLGEHVERAYQALALNETRDDFNCSRFEQTEGGRQKGQVLRQCWFTGSHSDIGGGWRDHDLSDLTLTWMASNIGDMLSLDYKYLFSLPKPVYPWGQQPPHNPTTGVFMLADTMQRQFPTSYSEVTHETIHSSVMEQHTLLPALKDDIAEHPELIVALMPLEEEMKLHWPYTPGKYTPDARTTATGVHSGKPTILEQLIKEGKRVGMQGVTKASENPRERAGFLYIDTVCSWNS